MPNPLDLTIDELCQFSPNELDAIARQAAALGTRSQLLQGRALMAMQLTQAHCDFGCSSVIHYAAAVLRQSEKDARCMRRIAWLLEELPLITAAVEAGLLSWHTLKLFVENCDGQNEEEWLARARCLSARELATLARQERATGDHDQPTPRETELRILLDRETTSLYSQAVRSLCEELGRRLNGQEIISALSFERLTGSAFPNDTTRERMRREMARDWQAEEARSAEIVAQAGHIAKSPAVRADRPISTPARTEAPASLTAVSGSASCKVYPNLAGGDSAEAGPLELKAANSDASAFIQEHAREAVPDSGLFAAPDNVADRGRPGQLKGRLVSLHQIDREWLPPRDSIDLEVSGSAPDPEPELEPEPEPDPLPNHWAAVSVIESPCPGESGVILARPGPSWQNARLRYNPENRLLTPAQRREILRRDGYQCSTPDCPNTLWLHTHHIAFYADGGMTVPDNLLTVCSACHRNLHNGNLKIERKTHRLRYTDKAGRSLRVFRPEPAPDWAQDGRLHGSSDPHSEP